MGYHKFQSLDKGFSETPKVCGNLRSRRAGIPHRGRPLCGSRYRAEADLDLPPRDFAREPQPSLFE